MMHDDYDPATGLPKERNIPGYDADEHASVADFVMGELEAEGFISPAEEDGAPDRYVVTSESVTEGHPDKMCDAISDAILDAILEEELAIDAENGTDEARNARCAVETFATMGGVIVSGEVRTRGYVDVQKIVRDTVNAIGYDDPRTCFDGHTCSVMTAIHEQSPDIAQGVDESFTAQRGNGDPYEAQGAGDQGIMFGYACNESETLMPLPIFLAHRLAERLSNVRKEGVLEWVRPDGKTQVSVVYEDGKPVAIDAVVVSTQHDGDVALDVVRQGVINNVIRPVMEKYGWDMPADEKVYVNPTGRFVLGGAAADTGLCLAEGTLVATPTGLRPIEELTNRNYVYTPKGNTVGIIDTFDNGVKETRIITDNHGISIESSLNHPFLVFEGTEMKWKQAAELKEGDILIKRGQQHQCSNDKHNRPFKYKKYKLGKNKGNNKEYKNIVIPKDENFFYLLGWLIGDGNTTADDRITFYFGDEDEKAHIYSILEQVFPKEEIKFYKCQPDRFLILSKEINKELRKIGVKPVKSFEKEIPDCVLRTTDCRKFAFLSGLFDADGYIERPPFRKKSPQIMLTTVSAKLAQQVSILLHSLGIVSSIYHTPAPAEHLRYDGMTISPNYCRWDIHIQGLLSKRLFAMNNGFQMSYKRERLQLFLESLPEHISISPVAEDAKYYRCPELVRIILHNNSHKAYKYFENYGSCASVKKNRGFNYKAIDYILDMFEEQKGTHCYDTLRDIFDNYEMVTIKHIEKSKAHTYDITLDDDEHAFIANGFVVHNTGRKVVVDTYGGIGKHGGGAFSGKDASKVDRSAAYAARHVAKNIVAAGLADRCEVQLSYAIGVARPISVWVECFGTEKVPLPAIRCAVDAVFDLRPAAIIENLDLIRPIYSKTSAYGHFGRELDEFTWEKCDKVELLRRACGLE